jgi:HlyD family secretion protein
MSPLLDARTRLELDNRLGASRAGLAQAQAGVQRAKLAEQDAIREQAELDQLAARGAAAAHDAVRAQLARETRVAERQSAEFAVHAASHDVAMAEASLARATKRGDDELVITSPVDGRVLRVIAQSEGPIAPGQPLLELGDPAAIEVVAEVLTSDAVTIVPGADVSIDGWGGAPLHARVRLVEPSAFTKVSALGVEEQRVFVVMDPQERAAWAPLGDGWRVEAHVTVWRGDDVVIAPTSALFRRGGAWAAFVVDDGRARLRVVEVGHRAGAQTEITKGLAPGEQVIIHPSDRLVEGGRVALR